MSRSLSRLALTARLVTVALTALAPLGCGRDRITGPAEERHDLSPLVVSASLSATTIRTLVITVSAADIATPMVFNLDADAASGVASGTLRLPAGAARTIGARAYDVSGELTHEGSATLTIARGSNPPLSLQLLPRNGQQPVTITVGDVSVTVLPSPAPSIATGATLQLSAAVHGPDRALMSGAEVVWASSDPSVARVSAAGLVTAWRAGTAEIVAVSHGVRGAVSLTVVATAAARAGGE